MSYLEFSPKPGKAAAGLVILGSGFLIALLLIALGQSILATLLRERGAGWVGGGGSAEDCLGPTTNETGIASKDGHNLPATKGKTGQEQHLALKEKNDSPTDYRDTQTPPNAYFTDSYSLVHYQISQTPDPAKNGMAGRFGARDKPSKITEERYYINMRWGYSTQGGGEITDPGSQSFWFEPQIILVTNPANGKQIRAAVIEYGPAARTGRVSGLSPEAMLALGAKTDDTLEYAFAPACARGSGGSIIEVARREIGTSENVAETRYGGGDGVAWCVYFATWVYHQAGLTAIPRRIANTKEMWDWFRNNQVAFTVADVENSKYQPQAGDLVFWDRGGDSGHTGIVESYNSSNKSATSIDGNLGNRVSQNNFIVNNNRQATGKIMGFGRIK